MPGPRWWIVLIAFAANELRASSDLEWQGFFTTGVAVSSVDNPYGGVRKKARFTDETLFGLNVGKELNDEWRVAAQVLARAGNADSAAKLDWAYATWQPTNQFNLTLGRQKIPLQMHSAYLDVGRAYPWGRPPEEVYSLFGLRSFTGLSLNTSIPTGDAQLQFKVYGGDVLLEGSPNAPTAESQVSATDMIGSTVEWNKGVWQLRAAYNIALWDLDQDPVYTYGQRRIELGTLGLKGELAGFQLWAEYVATRDQTEKKYDRLSAEMNRKFIEAILAGDQQSAVYYGSEALVYRVRSGGAHAYYLGLGRSIDDLLVMATWAELRRPFFEELSLNQRSIELSLEYDLSLDASIKLEAKKIFIPDNSRGLFDDFPEFREAMIYRLGYSLIF